MFFREVTAPDATLIRDDNELVTVFFEAAQSGTSLRIDFHLSRITAVIDVAHQGAVAIEKNGGPALVRRAGHFRNSRAALPALPSPSRVCRQPRRWHDWRSR